MSTTTHNLFSILYVVSCDGCGMLRYFTTKHYDNKLLSRRLLCRLRSIATHRDHFVRRPSVCPSVCHTFQSYVSQATHAFLGMLPLFYIISKYTFAQNTSFLRFMTILQKFNETDVFAKHVCPRLQQSPKLAIYSMKATVKVIDLGVI